MWVDPEVLEPTTCILCYPMLVFMRQSVAPAGMLLQALARPAPAGGNIRRPVFKPIPKGTLNRYARLFCVS